MPNLTIYLPARLEDSLYNLSKYSEKPAQAAKRLLCELLEKSNLSESNSLETDHLSDLLNKEQIEGFVEKLSNYQKSLENLENLVISQHKRIENLENVVISLEGDLRLLQSKDVSSSSEQKESMQAIEIASTIEETVPKSRSRRKPAKISD
jgi:hypothetical protein